MTGEEELVKGVERSGTTLGAGRDEGGVEINEHVGKIFRGADPIGFNSLPARMGETVFEGKVFTLDGFGFSPTTITDLLLDLDHAVGGFPGDIARLPLGKGLRKRKRGELGGRLAGSFSAWNSGRFRTERCHEFGKEIRGRGWGGGGES